MSACALKHWGAGTPCVKEPTSGSAKEMADKLAKMRLEREKQDTMWVQPMFDVETDKDNQPLISKKEKRSSK